MTYDANRDIYYNSYNYRGVQGVNSTHWWWKEIRLSEAYVSCHKQSLPIATNYKLIRELM